jgi:hypothetical protein
MEKDPVIKLNQIITDTIWSCPRHHGGAYECKILACCDNFRTPVKIQGSDIFVFVGGCHQQ